MITALINLFTLLLIVYYVLYLLRIPSNKWIELLHKVVDPALDFTRMLMKRYLPQITGSGIDWSPFVLFIALKVACWALGLLGRLPLIGWLF